MKKMEQRFMDINEASKLCGYSKNYFRKLCNNYNIPRYGPSLNRYSSDDLKKFMYDKQYFIDLPKFSKNRNLIKLEV